MKVAELLGQTDALAVTVAIGVVITFTVAVVEYAPLHVPLVTSTRYMVVVVILLAFNVLPVLAVTVQVFPPSVLYSHPLILPVSPESVKVALSPLQIVEALGDKVPPTEVGLTLITAESLSEEAHPRVLSNSIPVY